MTSGSLPSRMRHCVAELFTYDSQFPQGKNRKQRVFPKLANGRFLVHPVILAGLAVQLRGVELGPVVKTLVVGTVSTVASLATTFSALTSRFRFAECARVRCVPSPLDAVVLAIKELTRGWTVTADSARTEARIVVLSNLAIASSAAETSVQLVMPREPLVLLLANFTSATSSAAPSTTIALRLTGSRRARCPAATSLSWRTGLGRPEVLSRLSTTVVDASMDGVMRGLGRLAPVGAYLAIKVLRLALWSNSILFSSLLSLGPDIRLFRGGVRNHDGTPIMV